MDFINELKREKWFGDVYMNDWLYFQNGYAISIQASLAHACLPKRTFKTLTNYTAFEVAVMKDGEPINVSKLKGMKWVAKKYSADTILEYVEKEDVNKIIKRISGEI